MYRYTIAILAFIVCSGFTVSIVLQPTTYDPNTAVSSVLLALGDEAPEHYIGTVDMEKVGLGKDLLQLGGVYENGAVASPLSEHFVCLDCHNIQPESKFADDNDPASRLEFAKANNLPYLPGSTLYGITNRTSWFNGDHVKKYGKELIDPARHDLKNAIQLCSKECSVGRELTDEEMDATMHYLTSMELKMKDLNLSDEEFAGISANGQTEDEKADNIKLIKSKYLDGYPATFAEAIPSKERKMGKEGDLDNGKWIYEKSCLHCHGKDKVTSKTVFGKADGEKDFSWLVKYFKKSNGGSVYWITRHGTSSKEKNSEYMPIYSQEKLSDTQIEDLATYILVESKK